MLALSVAALVWSVGQFAHAETFFHAGCLLVSSSVWLVVVSFACAVCFDAGRHWVELHAYPKMYVAPAEDTVLFSSDTERVVRVRPPGYVPMSERPDPVTRLDIQRPPKEWKPPVGR